MQGHKGLELLMEGNVLGKKTPSAMAGGSHLVWLPLLLSGVFELSDSRHVHPEKNETFISNADVASLLGRFPIKLPEGINPENIHITSVNIESCTDMEAQIHLLNKQLQETTFRSSKQDEEAFGLRRNVRLLRMQLATCSSSASAVTGPYQTQLYSQMKLLLEKFDSDAFLNLKVIVLTREVTALQRRIELAANSTETEIMVLRNELQVKMKDLHAKKQQIERRFSNSELILQIISLQNQIWDLGVEELRRGETVLQPDSRIAALQTQLDMKLRKLRQQGDASSVLLEFISGHSRIAAIQRLINVHIAKSRANYADYQMQMRQKNELLAKKILRLNREESNTELTREILSLQDELATLTQMITHAKTSDRLTGLRVILEQGKSQQEHLQKQLEETDFGQAQLIMKIIGMIREGREQQRDGQQPTTSTTQTTVLTLLRGEYAKAQADIKELQRLVQEKSENCPGNKERYSDLKTEFEQKIAELNRTGDSKAAIILNVINLHGELTTLRDLISITKHPDRLSDLQRQLEQKEEELNSKTADMKRLIANPNLILSFNQLQQEIWELQESGLNGTTRNKQRVNTSFPELQTRVDGLIREMNNKGDESIKLMLKIMTLQSQVKQLQKELLDHHTVKDATVTQLEKDLSTKEKELKKSVDELTEKNQANAQLIVTITDLNNRLRKLQQEMQSGGQITSATITKLKKQLKIKEEEHFRDQVEITALQNELNQTTAQCSGFGKKIQELQTDLDEKLKKLQSESDSVTSLALQVSTITVQLEELKRQLQNTDSEAKIQELQKQIEEKNNKLAEKTEELKARSAQPQRFLDIISIQTKISKLVNTAANNTDYRKIRALQYHLTDLINGIRDENNENTQLLFKVLTLQEEVARLKKQEKSQSEAQLKKIKDLENELEDIRSQIAEKTLLLDSRDLIFSNLSAQIMELHQKIKPLEDEISDLKNQHAESFAELQARLSLTKRQLQDSELRLKDADAKNFKSMMDIIDLRDQLTKAEKQASKAAGKNIYVLEQQLQTQQRENKKLENSNRELKKQLKIKEEEHFRDQVEITALQNELNETTAQCSGFGKKIQELQTDLDEKLKKLQSESDSVSSLALQVSTITLQLEELKRQLQNTDSEAKIQELQKQIEEKNNKLAEKTEELKARSAQPQRFLDIISIQTKISKLVNTAANNTDYNQIRALQGQLNDLIDGIKDENNENTQLLFKVLTLQEEVARLKKQEKSQSEAQLKKIKDLENELEDIRSQIAEKTLLLYTRNSNFSNLSAEITELRQKIKPLEDEISDLKNQHAESFAELQARLSLTKRQLQDSELRLKDADAKNFKSMMDIIDLRDQLTKAQKQASKAAGKNIDVLEQQLQTQQRENKKLENSNRELKKQLKIKEEEHFRDQVEITALQNELNQTTAQCSGFGKKIQELQTDLDEKLKKLQSESDSVSSLALQVSTITLQLEELKRQLQNTDSEAKIQELQKQIEEKNNKLAEKTEELKARSAQPQRFLHIISIQTKISKLVNTAANNTDYNQIRALQGQLNDLIDGIQEENNENTQLLFKVLTLQEEVARLKKQEKSQSEAQLKKIKDLENELEDIRSQIAEKTLLLYTRNSNFSNLSAEITELRQKIKPLEDEISDLKNQHAESFAELQARLSLTKRQLQDSELRLKDADAKNFKSMMDIIDLRDQLTKAQKQASKAAGKNIDVLEQQLQTQQRENKKLENSNRELKKQLKIKEEEHFRDQVEITALQNELNQMTAQCSGFGKKIQELQTDLDEKLKKLQSESDSVSSLALQVSTITLQLEELKRQLQNTDSEAKIQELQKQIEEKNNKLAEKTEELKARSAQPQRFLDIISIQTKISKLVNTAANNTDYSQIRALQGQLNDLIDGIKEENNENTQLLFKVLTLQEEVARLKKQEKSQSEAQLKKIKDLENELEDIRSQIAEKTLLLYTRNSNFSNLSAEITELRQKIKPLEDEISDLKNQHAESFAELQARLSLTKRQLQDSELRLKDADAKNFKSMMDIIDLRDQLTKAQKQASKAAGKNIDVLEQQLQTQQRENQKLENSNRERQTQLQVCEQDMDRLGQQLQQGDARLKQLQQDTEEQMRQSNRRHQHENQILQDQLQQSKQKVEDLQQQLPAKDAMLNRLQQELEEKATENNGLQDKYSNLQNEKNELAEKVQGKYSFCLVEYPPKELLLYSVFSLYPGLQNQLSDVEDRTIHTRKSTFDPNTANPRIVLSADHTEMSTTEEVQNVQDHPGRFDVVLAILGETGFSSGRHYWEVSVAGKSCFHLGMASESAQRRGSIIFRPTNGYWTIVKNKQGQYRAIDNRSVVLRGQPQLLTLGILLDYEKGQVSFYNAGDRSHIYSFQSQRFTDKIHPFVNFCVEDTERRTPIVLLTPGSTEWIKNAV
ncbi:GRIP and coiled-coil domain-containing protein 2 isoform X4 [Pleuronectes platessa]|uniref:GRIP and coiled-coil domain-containing protein 2 isoform X4 n=1 Tax=Pleuronectes platessa TaxID=8262 RepID=UPI00232A5F56|nr:GRIP and coiled-coil domain-containing protein 2 isoform X4 [Pleuronectes platessa]